MWPPPLPLSDSQLDQLFALEEVALRFNARHNLYSEASARAFRERHLLHSLALATRPFPSDSVVVDWGTGGGMPGLVLAIVFPDTSFHLIDSVAKKIRSVRAMARRVGLDNVTAHHVRAERWPGAVTHSVSRATAPLLTLWEWHKQVEMPMRPVQGAWNPGLICLKGGALTEEVDALLKSDPTVDVTTHPLPSWIGSEGFEEKVIVEVKTEYQEGAS
jgi:16S rRNA (guanine527-N7)-methyltransferase